MKIGLVVPAFWPATVYGGPVHSLAGTVKALVKRGHDVTVVTADGNGTTRLDVPLRQRVPFHGAQVVYLPSPGANRRAFVPGLRSTLDRELRDVDIVHTSSIWTYTTWAGVGWAHKRGMPYVVSTRGNLIRWRATKNLTKRAALALGARARLSDARALHATSALERDELAAWGFTNIGIVPNGIDLPASLPDREAARAQWALGEDERAIVAIGRVHPVKRLELLIRSVAASRVEDARLLVAGTGPPEYLESLQRLARDVGLDDRCRFVGHVTGDAKWSLLRAADLFAQTSQFESFGMAIGEALGCGVPALITDRCSWEDLESRGAGRRVPDTALPQAVRDILADESTLRGMGKAGESWIRSDMTWDAVARQLATLYEQGVPRSG